MNLKSASELSLLLCSKNSSQTILDTLNSLIELLHHGANLIVVDGNSSDATIEIIQNFLKKNKINNCTITCQESTGLYAAFNEAIAQIETRWSMFVHSDDCLQNTNEIISYLESEADVVSFTVEIVGRKVNRIWRGPQKLEIISNDYPPHTGLLVKTSVYEKLGVFSEKYEIAADFDWVLRLIQKRETKYLNVPVAVYRMRAGGVSNAGFRAACKKFKEDMRIFQEHGYKSPFMKVILKKYVKLKQLKLKG